MCYLSKRGKTYAVHFVVAPDGRAIYDLSELNRFMETLSPPGIEHKKESFLDGGRGWGPISTGYLYFEEEVGTKNSSTETELMVTDQELLKIVSQSDYDFVDKQFKFKEENRGSLMRFVAINPMPSEEFAIALVNGDLRYTYLPSAFRHIGRRDFMEYSSQQDALENLVR